MFVYCYDEEIKLKLISSGYNFLCENIINGEKAFVFENCNKMKFTKEDKVFATNKLYF